MDFLLRLYHSHLVKFLKTRNLISFALGFFDILAITFSFQLSYLINFRFTGGGGFFFFMNPVLLKLFVIIMPLWLIVLYLMQVTEIPRTKRYRTLFFEYIFSASIVAISLVVLYFLFRSFNISRRFLVVFIFLGFIFLFLLRLAEYKLFKTYRSRGFNFLNIALVADESSSGFIDRLRNFPEWGYKIRAIFTDSGNLNEAYRGIFDIHPFKTFEILDNLLANEIIDEVLYVKSRINPNEVRKIIRSCEEFGVTFRVLANEKQPGLTDAFISVLAHEKFLTFTNIPHKPLALAVKKVADIFFSLVMIVLFSPLLILISLIILAVSGSPVIFSQERVGLRGRLFRMYKFRTMIRGAEQMKEDLAGRNVMDGPVFKVNEDPRVMPFGKFLRQTGLDELPQLFNVLKGEMSLIGPRPPLKEETEKYKSWQLRRLSVKPGLSCFWQIKPERNTIKFERWMEMDLAYIDNWSLRLDFMILIKTIKTIFQRTGI